MNAHRARFGTVAGGRVNRLELIRDQSRLLEAAIGRFAMPGDRYALLGFPDYANIGDSAIWLGATQMLRRLTGRPPVHVAGTETGGLAGLKRRLGTGRSTFPAGGNFGDLWRGHQELRERILAHFPHNRIVQLPQSIHFKSTAPVAAAGPGRSAGTATFTCSSATARAPPLRAGISTARSSLPPIARSASARWRPPPIRGIACFACGGRTRSKCLADWSATAPLRPRVADWNREPRLPILRLKLAAMAGRLLPGRGPNADATGSAFERLARQRAERGVALLSTGRQVITDRLHGHIMCVLLGIPHVALDNSYGKISAYYRDWTIGVEGAEFAADPRAAVAALSGLPERPWRG